MENSEVTRGQAAVVLGIAGYPVFPVHSVADGKCTCGNFKCAECR